MCSQQQWTLGVCSNSGCCQITQPHLKCFKFTELWFNELVRTCSKLYSYRLAYLDQPVKKFYNTVN